MKSSCNVALRQLEAKFESYVSTLPAQEQQAAQEMFKAYRYILSAKLTKSMSDRNLLSSPKIGGILIVRRKLDSKFILQGDVRDFEFSQSGRKRNSGRWWPKCCCADCRWVGEWPVFSKSACDYRSTSLTESFGYYDPATGRTMMPTDGGKLSYEDVIVFVVGGGNYSEYQHLQVSAKSQNPTRVILYGSTDIVSASQVWMKWVRYP